MIFNYDSDRKTCLIINFKAKYFAHGRAYGVALSKSVSRDREIFQVLDRGQFVGCVGVK
jgi:hypothetical protein